MPIDETPNRIQSGKPVGLQHVPPLPQARSGSVSPAMEGEIKTQLNILDNHISVLARELSQLCDEIDPVLSPKQHDGVRDGPNVTLSEVGGRVASASYQVEMLANFIAGVRTRITL